MQTNVGFAGKTFVAGLTWSIVSKKGSARHKKDIQVESEKTGFNKGVIIRSDTHDALGLGPKRSEFPSAAAVLAHANRIEKAKINEKESLDKESTLNWIVIEKIQSGEKEGLYWIGAVSDGVPLVDTDIVEDLLVAEGRLLELLSIFTSDVIIYTTDPHFLTYAEESDFVVNKGFDELIADLPDATIAGCRLKKVIGVPDWVIGLAFGVVSLTVISKSVLWYFDEQDQKAKKAALMMKRATEAKLAEEENLKNAALYKKMEDEIRQQEFTNIQKAINMPPSRLISEWYRVLNDEVKLDYGGWNVTEASCDRTQCTISLTRDPALGTNWSLREKMPKAEFNESGSASFSIPLNPLTPENFSLNHLTDWNSFVLNAGSQLQQLNMSKVVTATMGPRKDLMYKPPVLPNKEVKPGPGNQQQAPVMNKPLGYMAGNLTLKGIGLWQLKDIGEYISMVGYSVSTLKVDFPSSLGVDPNWSINGLYYLKGSAADSPAMPSSGMGNMNSGPMPPGSGPMPPANQPLKERMDG